MYPTKDIERNRHYNELQAKINRHIYLWNILISNVDSGQVMYVILWICLIMKTSFVWDICGLLIDEVIIKYSDGKKLYEINVILICEKKYLCGIFLME